MAITEFAPRRAGINYEPQAPAKSAWAPPPKMPVSTWVSKPAVAPVREPLEAFDSGAVTEALFDPRRPDPEDERRVVLAAINEALTRFDLANDDNIGRRLRSLANELRANAISSAQARMELDGHVAELERQRPASGFSAVDAFRAATAQPSPATPVVPNLFAPTPWTATLPPGGGVPMATKPSQEGKQWVDDWGNRPLLPVQSVSDPEQWYLQRYGEAAPSRAEAADRMYEEDFDAFKSFSDAFLQDQRRQHLFGDWFRPQPQLSLSTEYPVARPVPSISQWDLRRSLPDNIRHVWASIIDHLAEGYGAFGTALGNVGYIPFGLFNLVADDITNIYDFLWNPGPAPGELGHDQNRWIAAALGSTGLIAPSALLAPRGAIGAGLVLPMPRTAALPMDAESILQRALQGGFTIGQPVFHGAARAFDQFNPAAAVAAGQATRRNALLDDTNLAYVNNAVWTAVDPEIAAEFADRAARAAGEIGITNQQIYPLYYRSEHPVVYDRPEGVELPEMYVQVDVLFEAGHDAVIINNAITPNGGRATYVVVRDPNQVRSRFAAFDPARREEGGLLLSTVPWIPGATPVTVTTADGEPFGSSSAVRLRLPDGRIVVRTSDGGWAQEI